MRKVKSSVQLALCPGEWAQGQPSVNFQTQQKMNFAYCEELARNIYISKEKLWKDHTHVVFDTMSPIGSYQAGVSSMMH